MWHELAALIPPGRTRQMPQVRVVSPRLPLLDYEGLAVIRPQCSHSALGL